MQEKYPSSSLHRPLAVEYYTLNDLDEDSIRLPPRLPISQRGQVRQDPRFTSAFGTLDHDEKVEKVERYAQEVEWFVGKASKEVVFASKVYPLH